MVLLSDVALLVHVPVLDKVELDVSSLVVGNRDRTSRRGHNLAREVGLVGHLRTGRQRVTDVLLQRSDEVLVALAGHHGEHVHVMDDGGMVHAVAMLIDGQAQASADFLAAGDGVVAVLERADDEHVGVVPAFAQRRVREDEAHRLIQRQKALLVLQDEVVGLHIVGQARVFAALLDVRVNVALGLLVDGEVAAVGALGGDALEVLDIGRLVQVQHLVEIQVVFLFEDSGVLALLVGLRVVAVLGHLVDEVQRQDLHALLEQGLLFVEVGLDRLANLDAAQRCFGHVTSGIAHRQLQPVGETQCVSVGIDVRHHEAVAVLVQAVRKTV